MRTEDFRPKFVESFPDDLETGVFYISVAYNSCTHLCACGCGQEVITPLSPARWSFSYNGENVSVRPSVGNWVLACQSHYVIDNGRVRWARQFSMAEIARNRARDRLALGDQPRVGGERATAAAYEVSVTEGTSATSRSHGLLARIAKRICRRS